MRLTTLCLLLTACGDKDTETGVSDTDTPGDDTSEPGTDDSTSGNVLFEKRAITCVATPTAA